MSTQPCSARSRHRVGGSSQQGTSGCSVEQAIGRRAVAGDGAHKCLPVDSMAARSRARVRVRWSASRSISACPRCCVAPYRDAFSPAAVWRVVAQEGSASLEVGLPALAAPTTDGGEMAAVMIGVDPAKRSHAMAVLDQGETQLGALQVGNDSAGYRDMIRLARRWPERTWAVEGAAGVGVQLAQRLVADGETVLDVPPKLSTRARIFDVGHGRKNDPDDARTVAVVAIRTKGLRQVVPDDEMVALRLMSG